jgi:hypothetical protein
VARYSTNMCMQTRRLPMDATTRMAKAK